MDISFIKHDERALIASSKAFSTVEILSEINDQSLFLHLLTVLSVVMLEVDSFLVRNFFTTACVRFVFVKFQSGLVLGCSIFKGKLVLIELSSVYR